MKAKCANVANARRLKVAFVAGSCLVPPREPDLLATALLELLKDRDTRRRMGEEALALARRFSWNAIAGEHPGLCRTLRGEGKRARRRGTKPRRKGGLFYRMRLTLVISSSWGSTEHPSFAHMLSIFVLLERTKP